MSKHSIDCIMYNLQLLDDALPRCLCGRPADYDLPALAASHAELLAAGLRYQRARATRLLFEQQEKCVSWRELLELTGDMPREEVDRRAEAYMDRKRQIKQEEYDAQQALFDAIARADALAGGTL